MSERMSSTARERTARTMRRLRRWPASLWLGGTLVGLFVFAGLLSLVWTPDDAEHVDTANRLARIGTSGHLLGTDALGRDVVSQLMVGARNSLFVAVLSTALAVIPGVAIGLGVAGAPRAVRDVVSRTVDVGVALPGILVALVLATVLGPGNSAAIIAIVCWFVPLVARTTIGPARQVLSRDFVEASFGYGRRLPFILVRHVLPNTLPVIIVQASVMFASAILVEASLAYLGIGAQRPTPSWGRLLSDSQQYLTEAPHVTILPGVVIILVVLGFNLLGDGLRIVLDPQQTARDDPSPRSPATQDTSAGSSLVPATGGSSAA